MKQAENGKLHEMIHARSISSLAGVIQTKTIEVGADESEIENLLSSGIFSNIQNPNGGIGQEKRSVVMESHKSLEQSDQIQ